MCVKNRKDMCPWKQRHDKREARKLRRRLQRQYLRYDMGLMRGKQNKALARNLERERTLAMSFIACIKHGEILTEWDWTAAVLDMYFNDGENDDA